MILRYAYIRANCGLIGLEGAILRVAQFLVSRQHPIAEHERDQLGVSFHKRQERASTAAHGGLQVGGALATQQLAAQGAEIEICTTGADEQAALDALTALIADKFGEPS